MSVPQEANSETDKHTVLFLRSALGMTGGTGRDKKQGWEQGDVQCVGRPRTTSVDPTGSLEARMPWFGCGAALGMATLAKRLSAAQANLEGPAA